MKERIIKIILILSGVLFLEAIFIFAWFTYEKAGIKDAYKKEENLITANREIEKDRLLQDYNDKKHLATGKNVYQRIYNTQNQEIISLVSNLARESLPQTWSNDVRVEEFTNFILLIQVDNSGKNPSASQVVKHLSPIVKYSYPYLNNVAVFDKTHKCYLYFNKNILKKLRSVDALSSNNVSNALQEGRKFTKFNSIKIKYQVIEGHIFLSVTVGGVESILMMLDTGASTTMITKEVAFKTGDLNMVEKKTFSTANGKIECPIINRRVSVGLIDRDMAVAVNSNDQINLLGVDFFEGYYYSIDSNDNSIYMWER